MSTRRREGIHPLHLAALIALAGMVLGSALVRDPSPIEWPQGDKREHFIVGRWLGAGIFYAAYLSILLRLAFLPARTLTRLVLWVPAFLALALLASLVVAFAAGVAKEGIDAGTAGDVEAADVEATLAGAASILPPVAFLMVVTPILVPIDLLARLPRILRADLLLGLEPLKEYAAIRNAQDAVDRGPDVLLIEDDLVCATVAMRFLARRGLACRHVETFGEADRVLNHRASGIRLVLLDLFVRVEAGDSRETGADWLAGLEPRFPRSRRPFRVVVVSGHTRFLGDAAVLADLVLEKPWDPADLDRFLRLHGISSPAGPA